MNDILFLAWQYLKYNWIKTIVLIASISLILFLPLGLQMIVDQGSEMLTKRAESTPLLIGAKGSAIDLTLSALYFKQPVLDPISFAELQIVNNTDLALAIPLSLRYKVREFRIIGTSLEYLEFRNLTLKEGRLFSILGECVLGARAAEVLNVKIDDFILSSPAGAFDVAGSYPLKMKVVGILNPLGSIEDEGVFVDIKTSWVISGLAHGHMAMTKPEAESGVLQRAGDKVFANASVLSYTEITEKNIDSFHFHGNPEDYPLDAIIAIPKDRKSGILLRGRYEEQGEDVQILVPLNVISDLLDTVASVKNYILAGSIIVGFATLVTAVLVFVLSIRLRQREIMTIQKIGGTRKRVRAILATEIIIVITMSILFAFLLTIIVNQAGMVIVGGWLS
jgi:putative ABC transport system permease protein